MDSESRCDDCGGHVSEDNGCEFCAKLDRDRVRAFNAMLDALKRVNEINVGGLLADEIQAIIEKGEALRNGN